MGQTPGYHDELTAIIVALEEQLWLLDQAGQNVAAAELDSTICRLRGEASPTNILRAMAKGKCVTGLSLEN